MDMNALQPFDTYIAECAEKIKHRRAPHHHPSLDPEMIITANCPFELRPDQPTSTGKFRYGALLIHGLLDSPFTLRDIATQLNKAGILSRAVLLPGHGTLPADLLNVNYQEWVNAVRFGVNSLRQEVDHIFLVGYSTGGTLSIYHALHDANIKGIVLLAPALKILPPISTIVKLPILANFFSREDKWLCQEKEIDYTKYESVPFHPILELGKLINSIKKIEHPINCPVMLAMSMNDETVSAQAALDYFKAKTNGKSRSIIYTTNNNIRGGQRINVRNAAYPSLRIKQLSHIALPFAPDNPHYGQQGDHPDHSNPQANDILYGAYNRVQTRIYDQLYKAKLVKNRRSTLSYNPDFDYMAASIVDFITSIN